MKQTINPHPISGQWRQHRRVRCHSQMYVCLESAGPSAARLGMLAGSPTAAWISDGLHTAIQCRPTREIHPTPPAAACRQDKAGFIPPDKGGFTLLDKVGFTPRKPETDLQRRCAGKSSILSRKVIHPCYTADRQRLSRALCTGAKRRSTEWAIGEERSVSARCHIHER